jgi:aspartate ammonia-lyase
MMPATEELRAGEVTRLEHDLLGEMSIPQDSYVGIHTARATSNFPVTGVSIAAYPDLIAAYASIKEAAAAANCAVGRLSADRARAIALACADVRRGELDAYFVVDVLQGGAGTSTNMNLNEVIANRALEHLGRERGDYACLHPLEHVNLSQSTNDTYPTAVRMAAYVGLHRLATSLELLRAALAAKAVEFTGELKIGRTQLQDAVPMTLGQEFGAFATMVEQDQLRLYAAAELLLDVSLGGTAIGTGLNAPPGYADLALERLREISGLPLVAAQDLIEATQDAGPFVEVSGVLKRVAVNVSKLCNDLRLLASGPRAGLAEIQLPEVQAGSSIMPAKVNPVIPEMLNQICFQVIGNDLTVTMAAQAGQLQLNAFEPVIAHTLFESIARLTAGSTLLSQRCVSGIEANRSSLRSMVDDSVGIATALTPHIGYEAATAVAQQALGSGRGVRELVVEQGLLSHDQLDVILRPDTLVAG